jgi:hypothetical protein
VAQLWNVRPLAAWWILPRFLPASIAEDSVDGRHFEPGRFWGEILAVEGFGGFSIFDVAGFGELERFTVRAGSSAVSKRQEHF